MSLNAYERHLRWKTEQQRIYGRDFDKEHEERDTDAVTDLDILKQHHQFLKDEDLYDSDSDSSVKETPKDGDKQEKPASASSEYGKRLADKYYDSLFKEYAMADLKHYKTGNISLRWRTREEVRDRTGERTCGNLRCLARDVRLSTFELPFAYEEDGVSKATQVKAVFCKHCTKKLMYKKSKDREAQESEDQRKRKSRSGERDALHDDYSKHSKAPRRR